MTRDEKLDIIADILEVEPSELADNMQLEDFDTWDSVAILAIVSEVIDHTGKYMHASEIEALKTVEDLLKVLGD